METKNISFYIGRFQPFHLGHLDAIKQIFAKGKTKFLIIGIGSCEKSFEKRNPFTAGERFEMVYNALRENNISTEKFTIAQIRDMKNYTAWIYYIKHILPRFGNIYSGSKTIQELFSIDEKLKIHELKKNVNISATEIREKIKKGEKINGLLPKSTMDVLSRFDCKKRLINIENSNF